VTFHLPILPNELPYSYLVRWSSWSGYPAPRNALKTVMGTDSSQFKSTLPSHIPKLSMLTGATKQSLIKHHSIFPFFRLFCERARYNNIYKKLLVGDAKNVPLQLSMVSGRLTQPDKLGLCSSCITDDKKHYGVTYWHHFHQVPGQILCVIHKSRLNFAVVKRRNFLLPGDISVCDESPIQSSELIIGSILNEMLLSTRCFEGIGLRTVYLSRLSESGFTTTSGRLRVKKLREHLKTFYAPIVAFPIYARIFDADAANAFPASIFYGKESVSHPVKHALLIGLLFGTFANFFKHIDKMSERVNLSIDLSNFAMKRKSALIPSTALEITTGLHDGQSLSALSKKFGASVSVIKKLAIQTSLKINTRAQKLFEPEINEIIRMAKAGTKTQKIAARFNCSIGAVEQIIGQQLGLVEHRRQLRLDERRSVHEANLICAINVCKTRIEVRQQANASYLYLYKHDREWLYKTLPPAIKREDRYLGRNS
jgi:hypothetical protein